MKYRQRGYRDSDAKPAREKVKQEYSAEREAARQVRHAMRREASAVLRCADCGHQPEGEVLVQYDSICERCRAPLHNCRNCKFFDTRARFECRQEIPERIPNKGAANHCDFFEPRSVLDATGKRAAGGGGGAADNPKAAFDALFKKP